jgi:hypothetical protein
MPKKIQARDPVGAYKRQAIASRRIGGRICSECGEARPEALITGSNPIICAACDRQAHEWIPFDEHHVAGESNNSASVPIWVNDHRAWLSELQRDWLRETLENPRGDPLLAAAACIRGFAETIFYLIDKLLLWIPEMLESLAVILVEMRGPEWWVGTKIERFVPKRKSNVQP